MESNEPEEEIGKDFFVDKAKQSRAMCKKCKQKCVAGELRIAKCITNPFGSGKMKQWHHISCIFEILMKQRPSTKRIEDLDDIDGIDKLTKEETTELQNKIDEFTCKYVEIHGDKVLTKKVKPGTSAKKSDDKLHPDNFFRTFRKLVFNIANESSYLEKTDICKNMFTKGSDGSGFKSDILLYCRLLLPGVIKRIYNLQSKQLVKLFGKIFKTNHDRMLEHLEQGNISDTIQHFFQQSKHVTPSKKSLITLREVDQFLQELSILTKEDEQMDHFLNIIPKLTANDLCMIICLIKHDLRMNAGAKHILDAVHSDAYEAFQASRDLKSVLKRIQSNDLKATISVMTPVLPMLAESCKSVEQAMKKCPNGMYSEIKYDGERVQVHKQGSEFKYYSRSLKPVLAHKVNHFKEFIPKAFPHASDLILDSEVLMIDTANGKPLPFGTLGVHKKQLFKNANVCLFVFDCLYYNGETLMNKPIQERRKILQENMTEIPNHIVFSEVEEVHNAKDLAAMIAKVLKLGLEGLVLKDLMSVYEPGKRHWLKVKKDYLCDGAMADTADLIVLGAWYGTGKKGGIMSVFLMGCYDQFSERFCTVTKVHTGHDDKTLKCLQNELEMIKISSDPLKVPAWLNCTRTMVPDFIAKDPKKQPVWEITGAEFTQHDVHTADGISIRFPRVTRIRDDKTWETATNVQELQDLFSKSHERVDYNQLLNVDSSTSKNDQVEKPSKENKRKSESIDEPTKKLKIKNSSEDIKNTTVMTLDSVISASPDIGLFSKIKLFVLEGVKDFHNNVLRSFVAQGGKILSSDDLHEATHVLHLTDSVKDIIRTYSPSARHITADWIRECAEKDELVDCRPYTVSWIP